VRRKKISKKISKSMNTFGSGLPDGLFSNQNYKFGYILLDLGM
jgi:hypothetical protein